MTTQTAVLDRHEGVEIHKPRYELRARREGADEMLLEVWQPPMATPFYSRFPGGIRRLYRRQAIRPGRS